MPRATGALQGKDQRVRSRLEQELERQVDFEGGRTVVKPDPYLRIPPRPPRLPRGHYSMRPRWTESTKARIFLGTIVALVCLYAYLHHHVQPIR